MVLLMLCNEWRRCLACAPHIVIQWYTLLHLKPHPLWTFRFLCASYAPDMTCSFQVMHVSMHKWCIGKRLRRVLRVITCHFYLASSSNTEDKYCIYSNKCRPPINASLELHLMLINATHNDIHKLLYDTQNIFHFFAKCVIYFYISSAYLLCIHMVHVKWQNFLIRMSGKKRSERIAFKLKL